MAGVMTGALVLGGLADLVGRLKTLMLALIGTIAFEGFSAFAPSFTTMISLRFCGGMCCSLVILVSFVLSQELVGMNWRSFCGILLSMSFAVGIAVFSALAWALGTWRSLTLVSSLAGIPFLLLPCFIPESPRWLASQGRLEEAQQVLEGMARSNSTLDQLPHHWELQTTTKKSEKGGGTCMLASHPYVLTITFILIFSWFVNSATYYALTMAASDLGGDVYLSTALNGFIEIPACVLTLAIVDRLGRRTTLVGFMVVGGAACLSIQWLPGRYVTLVTSLALLGKLSISGSFTVAYIHSGEIFPTPIRNAGMGIVSVAARVGGILAPFILMLGEVLTNLQFTVLGLMALLAALLNLRLPETLGQPMPETVTDILALRDARKEHKYKELEAEDSESGLKVQPLAALRGSNKKGEDQVPLMDQDSE